MRYVGAIVTGVILILLLVFFNRNWGFGPSIGVLISPTHGYLQDPELYDMPDESILNLVGVTHPVDVYFDDRMVPHIFAENDADAFFIQGYLHARDRLWQMEFQTHFAAGRMSEIVGERALPLDRSHRRMGIAQSAEIGLAEMERDSLTKIALDAYTKGVNTYITDLNEFTYPLEYKLLNYAPELWTNFKTALLHKLMSKDLAAYDDDFEKTAVLAALGLEVYNLMYPYREDSLSPIIPKEFVAPAVEGLIVNPIDTTHPYFHPTPPPHLTMEKTDKNNGSNNWALAGSRTASGRPMLANDPHLKLSLPSIWYESQITTPEYSCYGVTLPGTPGIVIGFNRDVAFGFTNAMRDVLDYYRITFKDASRTAYKYNGAWVEVTQRIETYKVRSGSNHTDTVAYTHFGPVIYDHTFRGIRKGADRAWGQENYAIRWKAHDASNELKPFLKMMRARNYDDYREAISTYSCPGQNMIFASRQGDIAITQQGSFPAKWRYQGEFLMDGTDSTFEWQAMIPPEEVLTMKNPARGFVSSANQLPTETNNYPYYLGGDYIYERGYRINQVLMGMWRATVEDMKNLQNDNFHTRADQILPMLLIRIDSLSLNANALRWVDELKQWDKMNDATSIGATVFDLLMDSLEQNIWSDELVLSGFGMAPERNTLVQQLLRNPEFECVDNRFTPERERLADQLLKSILGITPVLDKLASENRLHWGLYKATCVPHLMDVNRNMESLSRLHLNVGGGEGIVNATQKSHGPSWKMVVHLTDSMEAYGIYPGGQSGHPGSPFYDNAVAPWARGEYFRLWFMQPSEVNSPKIYKKIRFEP